MNKKGRKLTLLVTGIILVIALSFFATSCITTDTAYRIGYDIGSSL